MKLTPIAALIFGLSASAVWADTTRNDATSATNSNPATAAARAGANGEQGGWQYVNGQAASSQAPTTVSQADDNKWSAEDDRTATSQEERGVPDQAATDAQDNSVTGDTASKEGEDNGGDRTATSQDETEDQADATNEDDASDQTAATQGEDDTAEQGAGMTNDEDGDEQSAEAQSEDGNDLIAALPDRDDEDSTNPQAVPSQAQAFKNFMQSIQDKMVVILPQGWTGSVEEVLEALEGTTDQEIVVLSQRSEEEASPSAHPTMDEEDDNDGDEDDEDK